jgi:hypothetical protein
MAMVRELRRMNAMDESLSLRAQKKHAAEHQSVCELEFYHRETLESQIDKILGKYTKN